MTRVWQISICFSTMHLSWTHVAILAAFLHSRISVQITVLTVLIKSIKWYLSYSTITITDYIMTRSYGIFVCFAFTPSTHQVVVIIVYPILLSKCPETDIFLWNLMCQTHRIHGTGIFTYMKTIQIKYTSWESEAILTFVHRVLRANVFRKNRSTSWVNSRQHVEHKAIWRLGRLSKKSCMVQVGNPVFFFAKNTMRSRNFPNERWQGLYLCFLLKLR